jgi:hypothetical protein
MRRDGARSATAARDAGLRRVTRLTWQITAAGIACAALIATAFGHNVTRARAATPQVPATQRGAGQLQIPAQPPAPASGAGQVISGAS